MRWAAWNPAIIFLGIVADPEEMHAVWYGMLNTLGIFELPELTDIERLTCAGKRHYFWFGKVGMAAILAGVFAVPLGIFLEGRAEITLAFIGAAVLFLLLFVLVKVINLNQEKIEGLRYPAEADSAGNEGRYRCGDRGFRKE